MLTAQIVIHGADAVPELGVSLNGSWPTFEAKQTQELLMPTGPYTHHVPGHLGLDYRLRIDGVHEGWNEVVVYHGDDAPSPEEHAERPGIRICSVELSVA